MNKNIARKRRQNKFITKHSKVTDKPRLTVFKSNKEIYATVVEQNTGKIIASASSLSMKLNKDKPADKATKVGQEIAKKAQDQKITDIAFDKGGYKYHGNVKALADAAREAGLNF